MADFPIHTPETAPEASKDLLEQVEKKYGRVPNLMGELAEAPAALEAYLELAQIFSDSSLEVVEQQVVLLTVSRENECGYCMAAHSTIARSVGMDDAVVEALRGGDEIPDEKLEALQTFTRAVVRERGWAGDDAVEAFLAAGFERRHVLEVVTGVALKTLSNYTNHLAETPVDEAFEAEKWTKETKAA